MDWTTEYLTDAVVDRTHMDEGHQQPAGAWDPIEKGV